VKDRNKRRHTQTISETANFNSVEGSEHIHGDSVEELRRSGSRNPDTVFRTLLFLVVIVIVRVGVVVIVVIVVVVVIVGVVIVVVGVVIISVGRHLKKMEGKEKREKEKSEKPKLKKGTRQSQSI
jgi:Flp pilus assembly protein TadB